MNICLVNIGGTKKIAEKYNLPNGYTIARWAKKYKEFGESSLGENRGKYTGLNKGRPRKLDISNEDKILRLEAENEYLRKILEKRENIIKKKQIILELSKKYPIGILLDISKIKRSSYYYWLNKRIVNTPKMLEDKYIIEKIKLLYEKHKGRYGVDRITHALVLDYGIKCNHKRIYRLMKENKLLATVKAKKKYITCGTPHPKHNVLKRNFDTSCPFDKLATDVTEIKHKGKKIYISPIKDLHTHVIESYEISDNASINIAISMLNKVKNKSILEGTILHSDQGGLYNNLVFQSILEENNFIQSMSRKGTPIDNSPMESFFATLKSELLYNPLIDNKNCDIKLEIDNYIWYYNNVRIQKTLGYLTPIQFKQKEMERLEKEKVLQN